MLACGMQCQPTEIRREIERFPSSTRPARVDTDQGEGFIKGVENPQGTVALVSELVCAELGIWLGLKIPPFAVVSVCDIDIEMMNHGGLIRPPLFFSQAVNGMPRDGGGTFLSRLAVPDDVARLVVFDTWVRNSDRYDEAGANSDNLLFVPTSRRDKYDLVPIDHTHCFIDAADVEFDPEPPEEDRIKDPTVYGNFPEFAPYISSRAVSNVLQCLALLERDFVVEIVNSVPPEWNLGDRAAASLVELICQRASYVVETIAAKLVDDPELPGMVV